MSDKLLNLLERAGWTFVQAFTATLVVADLSTARDALVAGIAAALSVVKTFAQDRLDK